MFFQMLETLSFAALGRLPVRAWHTVQILSIEAFFGIMVFRTLAGFY